MTKGEIDLVVIGGGIVGCYIAESAATQGMRVTLIEIGPALLNEQQPARPPIVCRRRPHQGTVAARNHVLGGNGHYWGGGLMRPPSLLLGEILGVDHHEIASPACHDTSSYFAAVEQRLGLPVPRPRVPASLVGSNGELLLEAEIYVLTSRLRNLALNCLARLNATSLCEIFTKATLVGFESDCGPDGRNIRALWIEQEGVRTRIIGRRFVIAAGVVDSNLIVQRFGRELLSIADISHLGRSLHDHWSVPIADLYMKGAGNLRKTLAPRFREGLIIGKHYELPQASGWGARGFLHFTYNFDEVSPYREIKQLLLLRQQNVGRARLFTSSLRYLHQLPAIARIGAEKVIAKRLFVADSVRVSATMDFESFPHPNNSLRFNDDHASFDWDISEEDNLSFMSLLAICRRTLARIEERYSVTIRPRFDWFSEAAALEYFHHTATDAYHLGGGLAIFGDTAATDFDLRIRGTVNLFVVSTAVFGRPGIVNPVHSLLALAQRFVEQQIKGV